MNNEKIGVEKEVKGTTPKRRKRGGARLKDSLKQENAVVYYEKRFGFDTETTWTDRNGNERTDRRYPMFQVHDVNGIVEKRVAFTLFGDYVERNDIDLDNLGNYHFSMADVNVIKPGDFWYETKDGEQVHNEMDNTIYEAGSVSVVAKEAL